MKNVKIASILLLSILSFACKKKQEMENSSMKMTEKADSTAMHMQTPSIKESDLVGRWIQPNPINKLDVQGFELFADNKAKSINMETLKYKKWTLDNDKLILTSESIGNHTSGMDTTAYPIKKIDASTLILMNGSMEMHYHKQTK